MGGDFLQLPLPLQPEAKYLRLSPRPVPATGERLRGEFPPGRSWGLLLPVVISRG